jgi:hypothetical protein
MADPTTAGYGAEPSEVEALLQNHCGYHLREADPLHRYLELTQDQVLYEALARAIRRERGKALAEMIDGGTPVPEVVALTRLGTRQRVQGLVRSGRGMNGQVGQGDADRGVGEGDQLQAAGADVPGDNHAGLA